MHLRPSLLRRAVLESLPRSPTGLPKSLGNETSVPKKRNKNKDLNANRLNSQVFYTWCIFFLFAHRSCAKKGQASRKRTKYVEGLQKTARLRKKLLLLK
jgi:hypothetical protein